MVPVGLGIFFTRFLLWTIPYKYVLRFHAWTISVFSRQGPPADEARYTARIVQLVKGVGRRVLGTKPCLPQALVTQWFLGRNQIDAELKLGVTRGKTGEFMAHAWIESDGDIVIGGRMSRYRYAKVDAVIGS
jgi:Transglutaminase-like superfamily